MPIILVTGKNGHGKGQFIIREILRLQKENDKREAQGKARRRIFTNIHGVNIAPNKPLIDCEPLPDNLLIFFGKQDDENNPPPDNYFVPPIGSIFIFDEAQEFDWIKNKSGALSNDLRVRSLETHRHAGLDVYFITQSPNYIHSHIQGLVSPHYYVERSMGLNTSNVFKYGNYQKSPDSPAIKKRADDNSVMRLGVQYGQYYKSSAEHNMKNPMPMKLKIGLAILAACVMYTVMRFNDAGFIGGSNDGAAVSAQTVQGQGVSQASSPTDTAQDEQISELERLERERQLVQYQRRIYLYQTQLPQDYEIIKADENLQVRGVVSFKGVCKAYNAHGDLMTLSQDECNYYLAEPGRVHKPKQSATSVQPAPVTTSSSSSTSDSTS